MGEVPQEEKQPVSKAARGAQEAGWDRADRTLCGTGKGEEARGPSHRPRGGKTLHVPGKQMMQAELLPEAEWGRRT